MQALPAQILAHRRAEVSEPFGEADKQRHRRCAAKNDDLGVEQILYRCQPG